MPDRETATPVVALAGLTKRFTAEAAAVDDVTLTVHEGELLALLGPSGCGKTTTLRLVAGFERPDRGRIELRGEEVAGPDRWVAPERRRVGVVFQDYALFPHLRVVDNVRYGVRDRRVRVARTAEMLELVGLADKAHRRPHELSGGEQQRVAIARALAPDPAIVLLDEPFSNLDAALRGRVREEVREILALARATAIVVTHDQEEALSIADRVAVMQRGRVLQCATPTELYVHPRARFVATFVGDADIVAGESDGRRANTPIGTVVLDAGAPVGAVDVVLRPEHLRLRLDGLGQAVVRRVTFFGHDQLVEVEVDGGARIRARLRPEAEFHVGERVAVNVNRPVVAFPVSGE